MSRGFIAAIIGIAMTLLAWFGPWAWPAWPAFSLLNLVFGSTDSWQELPYAGRSAVLVGLIVVNVGFWGGLAAAGVAAATRLTKRADGVSRS